MDIQLHDVDTVVECRLLIVHPAAPRLLTVREGSAWTLPALTPLEHHPAAVNHVNLAASRLFGFKTFVRRLAQETVEDAAYRSVTRCYELEVVDGMVKQRISRTAWAGRDVIGQMEFNLASDRTTIERWLDGHEFDGADSAEPAWNRPGWYESAATWMRRRAAAMGSPLEATPDQLWTDSAACVLSGPTGSGPLIMVAAHSTGGDAAPDWERVAAGLVPEPVSDDDRRHWTLYRLKQPPGD